MVTRSSADARHARALERELPDYPDERGEILLEAAHHWHRAGEHGRAIALLTECVELGGEDGGLARCSLADVLFDLGRGDEAQDQLDALRRDRPASITPYFLVGELLEERREYDEALRWFNIAVSRCTEEDLPGPDRDPGPLSFAGMILAGRRRVRRALGLPADNLDNKVVEPGAAPPFVDQAGLDDALSDNASRSVQVRVLFWPRPEIPLAHERWPQLVQHRDADTFLRERELANRQLAVAPNRTRIVMVPLTVAKLTEYAERTGKDVADDATRKACMEEIADEGGVIDWPPARNAPCWCGAGRKYKKCCGRPDLH
ncbi:SEC-C metal-binding domain-containing protein [Actinopolymorpha sp. B17G11]|uniref:SEC-C metal-binding domain-containing protein n=1 Tax=Actinopolymorpha sp. B17G11 TaxID=3160861 RepID=UPI0032E46655